MSDLFKQVDEVEAFYWKHVYRDPGSCVTLDAFKAMMAPTLPVLPELGEHEWHAVFGDFRNLTFGTLSKDPWQGGSNMTSTFKVTRSDIAAAKISDLEGELREAGDLIERLNSQLEEFRANGIG